VNKLKSKTKNLMEKTQMKKLIAILAVVTMITVVSSANANQFMNITFDGDTIGSAPSTGNSGTPLTNIGSLGGYTATAHNNPPTADNGTIVVDNVAGMNKAAVLTTNSANGEIGALYMDTGLNVVSSQLSVTFDIGVLAAPTTATSQAPYSLDGGAADKGVLFGLRTYASTIGQWAFSFAVVPTSDTGGVFALRDITNTQLTSFGSYTEGQKYNIALSSDYSTGTVNAYVDGVLGYSGYPLRTGAVANPTTTSELFIYFNGESGYSNQVALDNIQGFTTAVPEPTTMALLGLGSLSFVFRKKQ
jgi:hypothetical protein